MENEYKINCPKCGGPNSVFVQVERVIDSVANKAIYSNCTICHQHPYGGETRPDMTWMDTTLYSEEKEETKQISEGDSVA